MPRGKQFLNCMLAILLIATSAINARAAGLDDGKNAPAPASAACKPVYLTLDTGHMGVASFMADVLKRQQVTVTFFGANERTHAGGDQKGSLGPEWASWWKARAAEGHEFASHTFDHTYWRADVPGKPGEPMRFRVRPSAGTSEGNDATWTARQYCEEIGKASARLQEMTGQSTLPLFRAPGGKTSPALLNAAKACGYAHVGWSPAGFLGDELPSSSHSNAALLEKALRTIRSGDILLAHLGIWSRQDAWAPVVLEPLITGLKSRGFCFKTLREHPQYTGWLAQRAAVAPSGK